MSRLVNIGRHTHEVSDEVYQFGHTEKIYRIVLGSTIHLSVNPDSFWMWTEHEEIMVIDKKSLTYLYTDFDSCEI